MTPVLSTTVSAEYDTCYWCHGTGRCGTCNGAGVNYYGSQPFECETCDGTGNCYHCHGTGLLYIEGSSGHSDSYYSQTDSSNDTPGFELIFVLCAIAIGIFLWRKKRSV